MILKNIIYLDSSIKIVFDISGRDEFKTITSDYITYLAICYRIGLVKGSGDSITEIIKIEKKDITIIDRLLLISFRLDDLHKPLDCEITLDSITLIGKDNTKYKTEIKETFFFRSIVSDDSTFFELLDSKKENKETPTQKLTLKHGITGIPRKGSKKSLDHFTDSYEQFKDTLKNTEFLDILKLKTGTIDFNLKNFGISLLCKLLLLTKFVNELVDNEFQDDLQQFLKINFIKKAKSGGLT